MSQRIVPIDKTKEAQIGWDQPMLTYYAQIYKLDESGRRVSAEHGGTILWVGTKQTELYTLEDLIVALRGQLKLTHEMKVQLHCDRDEGL
jgi:hypothetical protein